jgi:gamma-glutamyl phosphate reductase
MPAGVTVHGGERAAGMLGLPAAPAARHEYSSMDVTVELVGSLTEAIDHIHAHGSSHTECIVTGAASGLAWGWLGQVLLPAVHLRGVRMYPAWF